MKKHMLSPTLSILAVAVVSSLIALAQIFSFMRLAKPNIFPTQDIQTNIKAYSNSAAGFRLQNTRRASHQNQINHNDYSIRHPHK